MKSRREIIIPVVGAILIVVGNDGVFGAMTNAVLMLIFPEAFKNAYRINMGIHPDGILSVFDSMFLSMCLVNWSVPKHRGKRDEGRAIIRRSEANR